jgi:hypothetical protein
MKYPCTVKELANHLRFSYSPISKLCAKLKIPKLGKTYMISESDAQLIRSRLHDGPGNPEFGKGFWDKRR